MHGTTSLGRNSWPASALRKVDLPRLNSPTTATVKRHAAIDQVQTGVVYAQNPADLGERAKTRFEARLKTPAGKNIVSLMRPFDDPLPADVRDLDLITFLFFYHDTTYMNVDRAEMAALVTELCNG